MNFALLKCFDLYVALTKNPDSSGILEYGSRYKKLSNDEQGELAHRIHEHFHGARS